MLNWIKILPIFLVIFLVCSCNLASAVELSEMQQVQNEANTIKNTLNVNGFDYSIIDKLLLLKNSLTAIKDKSEKQLKKA